MSSNETVIRRGTYTDFWDEPSSHCKQPEVAVFRRVLEPNFLPSGISGFTLYKSDHIALFVSESAPDHLPMLAKFIAAGYLNPDTSEVLSLELSQGRSPQLASRLIEEAAMSSLDQRVDVRDSDRNYGDYEPEHFTLEGMWQAMQSERGRFLPSSRKKLLRCASEDCSAFLGWLDNPHEYLAYESRLDIDLGKILGGTYVQLCTFRTDMLDQLGSSGHIQTNRAIEEILASHTRVIFATENRLLFDRAARSALRHRYPISPLSRLAIRVRSLLTRAKARITMRAQY